MREIYFTVKLPNTPHTSFQTPQTSAGCLDWNQNYCEGYCIHLRVGLGSSLETKLFLEYFAWGEISLWFFINFVWWNTRGVCSMCCEKFTVCTVHTCIYVIKILMISYSRLILINLVHVQVKNLQSYCVSGCDNFNKYDAVSGGFNLFSAHFITIFDENWKPPFFIPGYSWTDSTQGMMYHLLV